MATGKELGLRPGDIAVYSFARTRTRGGLPVDAIGNDVQSTVCVAKVLETNQGTTLFEVLASHTEETFEPDVPGRKRWLSQVFPGIIDKDGEKDPKLAERIRNSGIIPYEDINEHGEAVYGVHVFPWRHKQKRWQWPHEVERQRRDAELSTRSRFPRIR